MNQHPQTPAGINRKCSSSKSGGSTLWDSLNNNDDRTNYLQEPKPNILLRSPYIYFQCFPSQNVQVSAYNAERRMSCYVFYYLWFIGLSIFLRKTKKKKVER